MAVQKLFPSELHTQVAKAQKVLDEVSLSLIRKRQRQREEEENHNQKSGAEELEVQRIPNDFLDLLFDARDKTTGQALTEVEVLSLSLSFSHHFASGSNILCFVSFIKLSLSIWYVQIRDQANTFLLAGHETTGEKSIEANLTFVCACVLYF